MAGKKNGVAKSRNLARKTPKGGYHAIGGVPVTAIAYDKAMEWIYRNGAAYAGKAYRGAANYVKGRIAANKPKSSAKSATTRIAKRTRSFTGHSVGVFKGKFKRPKKIRRTIEAKCLAMGAHRIVEQFGEVSDADCVHLAHSSGYIEEIAKVIYTALMRKVMNKAGFKISGLYNEIAVSNPTAGVNQAENSLGLRFVYTKKSPGGTDVENAVYDTTDNQNFGDVLNSFTAFVNHVIDYIRGTGGGIRELQTPHKLAVYTLDRYSGNSEEGFWRLGAEIHLEDITADIYISSHMVVQNRTKAASAASTEFSVDRVDTQPLKGWIYEFKHGDPRVRFSKGNATVNNAVFDKMNDRGLQLIKASEFNPSVEPFDPKYFANIGKATRVTLNPGEMKRLGFSYKFHGKLTNLIRKLQCTQWITGAAGSTFFTGMVGKSQMISLEELMRTPSSNKIEVAYERELKVGCIVRYKYHDTQLDKITNPIEYNNTS